MRGFGRRTPLVFIQIVMLGEYLHRSSHRRMLPVRQRDTSGGLAARRPAGVPAAGGR
jgi:hypothetical protein